METDHQRRTRLPEQRIDSSPRDASALAEALGAAEADLADAKLRLQESLERERRLSELLQEAEEALANALRNEHDLRKKISGYADFNRAIERSFPWRVIQWLRRLVGREW